MLFMNHAASRRILFRILLAVMGLLPFSQAKSADMHALQLSAVPSAVSSKQAIPMNAANASQRLQLAIHLPARNSDALDEFLQALYDPAGPSFHQYLSVEQFTEQFGPTQADYDQVVAWATAQGFKITNTTANRRIVDVEGSVSTIDRAFNLVLNNYQDSDSDRIFFAPDREPSVALAVPLLGITGLDNATLPVHKSHRGSSDQIARARAASAGSGPKGVYLPSDMRAAYYGSGPLDGAGQTIGIFSFDGYRLDDVPTFYRKAGVISPPVVPITNILVNNYNGVCYDGNSSGTPCDDGEQVLDIVNAIGMAPGTSQILFYEGSSGPDILNQMATDNLAKVISCSWGDSNLGSVSVPIFQEFVAQGQTFLNATGDDGAYDHFTWAPPSLDPYVLQVGGTSLVTNGAGGGWMSETAWPDSGGGFYAPALVSIPSWQTPAINAANGGSTTLRNDPDVAAEGNFDNPTVSDGVYMDGFGGTSFAAPRWAGFIALANQQALATGHQVLGFVNPALYGVGLGAHFATNFHDVKMGSNPASNNASIFYNAVTGYDLVTGWGSPTGQTLIDSLTSSTFTAGYTLFASPVSVGLTRGGTTTATITVNPIGGFSDTVNLAVTSTLPSGVTASFNPTSTTSTSTLTLTASSSATLGAMTPVTITANDGTQQRTATLNLFLGAPASASVTPTSHTFNTTLPNVPQSFEDFFISNASGSIPLIYSATTAMDASCTGPTVAWLQPRLASTVLKGGQQSMMDIRMLGSASSLGAGTYTAYLCIGTNDPNHETIAVPFTVTVVATVTPGPTIETIFESGFEVGDNGGNHIVSFAVDGSVANDAAGSSLDLVTGYFHPYDAQLVDNVKFYRSSGLAVYWYDDVIDPSLAPNVGGVIDGTGAYQVLHSGAVIGPTSMFANGSYGGPSGHGVPPQLSNWHVITDGYLGIAFVNSRTQQINYGYLHLVTSGTTGFPATIADYAFDETGAAIQIP